MKWTPRPIQADDAYGTLLLSRVLRTEADSCARGLLWCMLEAPPEHRQFWVDEYLAFFFLDYRN